MIKHSKEFHNKLMKKVHSNPEALAEYKAFSLQLEVSEKMKEARKSARLTQEQVANKMGTKKPAIARLESSNLTTSHSPSINTLAKYANAVGKEIRIEFVKSNHAYHN